MIRVVRRIERMKTSIRYRIIVTLSAAVAVLSFATGRILMGVFHLVVMIIAVSILIQQRRGARQTDAPSHLHIHKSEEDT